jgi:glycosyltransferase involved in cell wall biosynthesis
MVHKALTLSIVIPACNEERYIKACLDAIAAQTIKPDEVIVVDNNSTDKTIQIAKDYKFVKILHEPRQHQVFAQATGFNAASSDILGRIDADSILSTDWVAQVKKIFTNEPNTVAITGSAIPYDVFLRYFGQKVFEFYNSLISFLLRKRMIWGANCAFRRETWLKISDKVLQRADIWEDHDLAFRLAPYGAIKFIKKTINVGASFRATHKSFFTQIRYQFRMIRTLYLLRVNPVKILLIIVLWYTMIILFPITLVDEYILKPLSKIIAGRTYEARIIS